MNKIRRQYFQCCIIIMEAKVTLIKLSFTSFYSNPFIKFVNSWTMLLNYEDVYYFKLLNIINNWRI